MYYFSSGTGPKQEEQIRNSQFSVWDNKLTFAEVPFQGDGRGVGVGDIPWSRRGGSTIQIGTWTFVASLLKKKSLDC